MEEKPKVLLFLQNLFLLINLWNEMGFDIDWGYLYGKKLGEWNLFPTFFTSRSCSLQSSLNFQLSSTLDLNLVSEIKWKLERERQQTIEDFLHSKNVFTHNTIHNNGAGFQGRLTDFLSGLWAGPAIIIIQRLARREDDSLRIIYRSFNDQLKFTIVK